MNETDLPLHPLCEWFPPLPDDELASLAESVRANGLRNPIVLLDGAILDGRNRYAACKRAGVEPVFVEFDGGDPLAFVLDANLDRRHLTAGQRAALASEMATAERGGDRGANQHGSWQGIDQFSATTLDEAARRCKTSRDSVVRYRRVADADPALAEAVRAGNTSLNAAVAEMERAVRAKAAERAAPQTAAKRNPSSEVKAAPAEPAPVKTEALPATTEPPRPIPANDDDDRVAELSKQVLEWRKENERLRNELVKARADVDKQVTKRVDAYIAEHLDADARKALKLAKNTVHLRYPLTTKEFNTLMFAVAEDQQKNNEENRKRAHMLLMEKKPQLVAPERPVGPTPRVAPPPLPTDLKARFAAAEAQRKEDARLRRDAKRAKKGEAA